MDLAELILANKAGRSYATLARDCGDAIGAKRLQHIATLTRPLANFPDPPSIRGLARGLRVTERTVILAAAESLGLDVGQALPPLVEQLPVGTEQLTDQEVSTVVTMVRTLLAGKRVADDGAAGEQSPGEVLRKARRRARDDAAADDRGDARRHGT